MRAIAGELPSRNVVPRSEQATVEIRFGPGIRGPRTELRALVGGDAPAELAPLLEPETSEAITALENAPTIEFVPPDEEAATVLVPLAPGSTQQRSAPTKIGQNTVPLLLASFFSAASALLFWLAA